MSAGVDRAGLEHFVQKLPQLRVVILPHNDEREVLNLPRLHESEHFKKLIHRSKATRQDDKGVGVLEEKHLPDKEMLQSDVSVQICIGLLFRRQVDVATYGDATGFLCSAIGGFHNSWPATRHDSEAETRNGFADFARASVVGMSFWKPRTAEHRHTGTAKMQGAEPSNEFHQHATDEFEFT